MAQLPGAGDSTRRTPVDAGVVPWSSLVRVQAPGLTRCTGVSLGSFHRLLEMGWDEDTCKTWSLMSFTRIPNLPLSPPPFVSVLKVVYTARLGVQQVVARLQAYMRAQWQFMAT